MYQTYIKRLFSLLLSLVGMVCLSWLFVLIAIVIKLDSPGPVVFRQKRVGAGKEYFEILKFRTMRMDAPSDVATHLLTEPDRFVTPVGRFLRRFSLDELPQLYNIFKGDMAIVGPRPALWNQFDLIEERDKYGVNDIRPGLTGWAQINGRDELSVDVKAWYDAEYLKKMSFAFDCKILFATVGKVLRHDGVQEDGSGKKEDQISC